MVRGDLTLSEIPHLENYALLLNTGFNIASIVDNTTKTKLCWQKTYKGEEAFEYQLVSREDTLKQLIAEWMEEFNQRRPHEALNNQAPIEWKNNLPKMK